MAYNTATDAKSTEKTGPQTPCSFWANQIGTWTMLDTLLAGTEAMRLAGKTYLPKYEVEPQSAYEVRLQRSTLLNYYKRTVTGLVGKPFSKPITVPEDVPDELTELFDDIDKQGNNLDAFARNAFRTGLAKGMVHILADFPTASEQITTLADERAVGATPYLVIIKPENLIAAFAEIEDGVEVLKHVRIKECETVKDGWSEKEIHRVRVLEPGKWQLWRRGDKKDDEYTLESEGVTTLDYIPLVTFYAEKEGLMCSRPPLVDLAYLNVAHWQSSSDQRNVLTITRFPILGASGVDPEQKIEVGPNSYFAIRDPQGKMYYIEHSGAAIDAGRTDLEDLKTEMAMMGLQLLMPKQSGDITATASAQDGAEANCGLQTLVLDFQGVLNLALDMLGDWLDLPEDTEPGDVLINSNFGLSLSQQSDLTVLLAARANKEISHEAFILELKRRGILPSDFDMVEDAKLIKDDVTSPSEAGAGLPPRRPPFGDRGANPPPASPAPGAPPKDPQDGNTPPQE